MEVQTAEINTAGRTTPENHNLIASDRVEGTRVFRSSGEKIGTIQRLMIDKLSGNVVYAVLSFGWFLGIGQLHLPIQWARLKYDPTQAGYLVDLTDEELGRAPAHERIRSSTGAIEVKAL